MTFFCGNHLLLVAGLGLVLVAGIPLALVPEFDMVSVAEFGLIFVAGLGQIPVAGLGQVLVAGVGLLWASNCSDCCNLSLLISLMLQCRCLRMVHPFPKPFPMNYWYAPGVVSCACHRLPVTLTAAASCFLSLSALLLVNTVFNAAKRHLYQCHFPVLYPTLILRLRLMLE